jgi:hypothetical protein
MSNIARRGATWQLEISAVRAKQTFNTYTSLTFQSKIAQTTLAAVARMIGPLCLTYGAMLVSSQILTR